jgi:hypothetical protein
MHHIKYKGETYSCCAPRKINGEYTCDAWKTGTGKVVNNFEVCNALAKLLISGKVVNGDKRRT